MSIVPLQNIIALKNSGYSYRGEDTSLLCNIFSKITQFLVPYIPNYIAPNLITMIGFIFTLIATVYAFYGNIIGFIVSVIIYMLLDNLDGAHARKTGLSSPTGELLDHSLDSISNTLITLSLCTLGGISISATFWIVQCMNIIFYCSHISSYYNGILKIGSIGPAESVFVATGLVYICEYNNYNLNNIFSYVITMVLYYVMAGMFFIITRYPLILKTEKYITDEQFKIKNINQLTILSIPMLIIPLFINKITVSDIITYSGVYHILTTETILSKILKKSFNINILLVSVLLIMGIDLPIMSTITFLWYYITILTIFQTYIPSSICISKKLIF